MVRNKYILILLLFGVSINAQETRVEPIEGLYLEVFVNGLRDFNNDGVDPDDLGSTLGYGWGFGLQASMILEKGFGLAFKVNNDIIALSDNEEEELESGLPKAIHQSVYQGLTYRTITDDKRGSYVEGMLGFGWARYRIPTVKYKNGYTYELKNVSGFSTFWNLGYGHQYSRRSSIKIYLSSTIDFLSHDYKRGAFTESDHGEYFTLRISIGHVIKL